MESIGGRKGESRGAAHLEDAQYAGHVPRGIHHHRLARVRVGDDVHKVRHLSGEREHLLLHRITRIARGYTQLLSAQQLLEV
jgi:hypothetical protein